MKVGDELLQDRLSLREQMLMQQADALDMKASILLVAVTFLATHSMWVLSKSLPKVVLYDQFLSIALQTVAGALLAIQLRICSYSVVTAEAFPAWRDELIKYTGEGKKTEIEQALAEGIIQKSIECITDAINANNKKAGAIKAAFWIILASFVCNLAGAAALLF